MSEDDISVMFNNANPICSETSVKFTTYNASDICNLSKIFLLNNPLFPADVLYTTKSCLLFSAIICV